MNEKEKSVPKRRFKEFKNSDAWEQRKIGDHCEMFNGDRSSKYPNAQDMVSDGIPFINAGDLENGHVNLKSAKKISREKYDELSGAKLQLGDIVYCLRGTLGKNAYIDNFDKGTVASSLVAIRPKNIDGRYLYYILNSDIEYKQRIVHDEGAAQPNLSAKSVSEFVMPVPDIDEQKKISAYFSNLDHLIALHQRKLDKSKALKSAYLSEMFPAEGQRTPKRRFAGFTDDWELRKLSEIATMKARIGWQGLTQKEFLDKGEYYLITGTDFDNGIIDFSQCHYISKARYDQDTNIQIKNDDVLITKDGTIGKVAYIKGLDKPGTLNAGVFVIRGNDTNISNLYLYHYLAAPYLLDYADKHATGGTIKHLNQNVLVGFPIPLPSIHEQQKIGEYLSTIDNLITLHQRELEKLQNIKKAYLNEMFI